MSAMDFNTRVYYLHVLTLDVCHEIFRFPSDTTLLCTVWQETPLPTHFSSILILCGFVRGHLHENNRNMLASFMLIRQ